jgi:hypothetical protein
VQLAESEKAGDHACRLGKLSLKRFVGKALDFR